MPNCCIGVFQFDCCAIDNYGWYMYRQSRWFIDQPHDGKLMN